VPRERKPARHYDPETIATAIRRYMAGDSAVRIASDLGVTRFVVHRWINNHDPTHKPVPRQTYQRNAEELAQLVYDTVTETLNAIRARAIATRSVEWITAQSANDLAQLDAAQWDRVIRMVQALRPRPASDEEAGDAADAADDEPAVHRNGTLDTTD
jgi:hypothetical protein